MKDIGESATVHGFRSSFRDWAGERGTDRQIAELCLAHDTHSDTESAYSRSDMIERRRTVMEEWSKHCAE